MAFIRKIRRDGKSYDVGAKNLQNDFTQTEAGVNALDAAAGKSLNDSLAEASALATRASTALLSASYFPFGTSKTITFTAYTTAAIIFGAIHTGKPFLYIFANGYLAPVQTNADIAASLSSDYKTVTLNNTSASLSGHVGVICMPPSTATIS